MTTQIKDVLDIYDLENNVSSQANFFKLPQTFQSWGILDGDISSVLLEIYIAIGILLSFFQYSVDKIFLRYLGIYETFLFVNTKVNTKKLLIKS